MVSQILTVLGFLAACHGIPASIIGLDYLYSKYQDPIERFFMPPVQGKNSFIVIPDPKVARDDPSVMKQILRRRRYHINELVGPQASKQNIFKEIKKIAELSDESSQTIFYFSGHGTKLGLAHYDTNQILEEFESQRPDTLTLDKLIQLAIQPYELFEGLSKIKGKQAIILDSCHSGIFLEYLKNPCQESNLRNFVLIAACKDNETTESSNAFELYGGNGTGALTFCLKEYIKRNKNSNLATADIVSPNKALELAILNGYAQLGVDVSRKVRELEKNQSDLMKISDTDFYF